MLALFRIIEPTEGTILIDSIDITKIGLHDRAIIPSLIQIIFSNILAVRSGISIVPQSPDLFEGTLRENIDPVGEHGDPEIWTALGQVRINSGNTLTKSDVISRPISRDMWKDCLKD